MRFILHELSRYRWLLGICASALFLINVIGIEPTSQWALLVYKLSVVTMAVIVADLITWSVFPVVAQFDLIKIMGSKNNYSMIGVGLIYLARCLVMLGIILGVTLGL